MTIAVSNQGKALILAAMLAGDTKLRLFGNNVTPNTTTHTEADFTVLSGGGYADKTLTGGSWSITNGVATYAEQTFTFTGAIGSGCYGYEVLRASDNKHLWAELLPGALPSPISNNGDQIKVTPRYELTP